MRATLKYLGLFFLPLLIVYVSCQKEYSFENGKINLPPIAKAGKDTAITYPCDSVLLDGSSSYDPDGVIVAFQWRKISGPSSYSIIDSNNKISEVNNLDTAIYRFELKVTDDGGLSAKDTISVYVESGPVNHAPVADAWPDQEIILPVNKGILDGSASYDLDNDIVSYKWTKISGPSPFQIANPTDPLTEATNLSAGVYLFELLVTDATGLFSKDTVKITVRTGPVVPPVADAGADQTIIYNLNSCSLIQSEITLDGSASFDPDGFIVKYQWSVATADNSLVAIISPNTPITTINIPGPGDYGIILKVTDNDGATDSDTIRVTTQYINRETVNAKLVPLGKLSEKRKVSAVAAANGKIVIAGGIPLPMGPGPAISATVDIYDIASGSWSAESLSQARTDISAVNLADKIFFIGGVAPYTGTTSRVDIYSASTNLWSQSEMKNRGSKYGVVAMGDKVYAAGGSYVNIYDNITSVWSTKTISQSRSLITALRVRKIPNPVIYFMGGIQENGNRDLSSRIDIYDPDANSWSTSELSEPKYGMAAIGAIIAGGTTQNGTTNKADSVPGGDAGCLFQPNTFSYHSCGIVGNDMVFFVWGGKAKDKFDIYNGLTGKWSIGLLDRSITPSLIITVDNKIYVVGGEADNNGYHDQLWRLEF